MVYEKRRDVAAQSHSLAVHIDLCHLYAADDKSSINWRRVPRRVGGVRALTSSGEVDGDPVSGPMHLFLILRGQVPERRMLEEFVGFVEVYVGRLDVFRFVWYNRVVVSIITIQVQVGILFGLFLQGNFP